LGAIDNNVLEPITVHTALPAETSSFYLLSRLFRDYVRPHVKKIFFALSCMVIVASATAANAWMMQPALDKIFVEKDTKMLALIPIAVIILAMIKGIAGYGQSVAMAYLGRSIITDIKKELYNHLLYADVALLSGQSSGTLISRFTHDIEIMRYSIANILTGIGREALTLVFLVGVMFYQSWELALIAFTVFPITIFPMLKISRRMRKIARNTQQELGEFTTRLDETFQGVRMIKAYAREGYESKRATGTLDSLFRLYAKAARTEAITSPLTETLGGISVAAVIWYGGSHVLDGTTTPGAFFSFITALLMAYKPVKGLSKLNSNVQEGLAAAQRLFSVLDTHAHVIDAPNAKALVLTQGEIHFHHVSFRYGKDKTALDDISIHVPPGKMVALVGKSGGGKSTLTNLLLRFYDPHSGTITIDRQDIRQVTLTSLRESMAVVNQEVTLFDDTVRANIAYGKLDATEEEIVQAAKMAAAHEFIMELPEGYDAMIGQRGVKLSGGQRQRIAIARAMLKNAPILLLDEATSALDTVSELQIQKALDRLMEGRSTLVIAHRLSTIMHADIIYVMENGRVVESGTHEALLAQGGAYSTLYLQQHNGMLEE
jgi:subfamily B ATP-binding cassette protein MsbA